MSHLSDREFVDLIDNVLPPVRVAHVLDCDDCRSKADTMRELLVRASEVEVPEPSPLFWEHFSSRVHHGIDHAEIGNSPAWGSGWRWVVPIALMTIVAFGVWRWTPRVHAPVPTHAELATGTDAVSDTSDADTDEAWAIVRTVADESTWDDVTDASVHQGSAEGAVAMLTREERQELVRLLELETKKRPGA